jgi:DNA-binding NarL/FixJ family response regulator
MTFEEARDGEEVFQKLKAYHPNLIFMDVRLPGQSGLEITKKIRNSHCQATIIVLTSFDLLEYGETASMEEADYFISKSSSTTEEILALVDSILSDPIQAKMNETKGKKPEELL